jgi:hypothetical protein
MIAEKSLGAAPSTPAAFGNPFPPAVGITYVRLLEGECELTSVLALRLFVFLSSCHYQEIVGIYRIDEFHAYCPRIARIVGAKLSTVRRIPLTAQKLSECLRRVASWQHTDGDRSLLVSISKEVRLIDPFELELILSTPEKQLTPRQMAKLGAFLGAVRVKRALLENT